MTFTLRGACRLEILYEDDEIFVIAKQAGIHSVMTAGSSSPSVAALLLGAHEGLGGVGKRPEDAGLVQRLDYETSGCLIGAKHKAAWQRLYADLRAGRIDKSYLAIVEGALVERIEVESLIGSPYRRAGKVRVAPLDSAQKRMQPARSLFERIAHLPREDLSLVRAHAAAARRHQLRAHLAWLGHPLAGDALYGSRRTLPAPAGASFMLHAAEVSLPPAPGGAALRICAPAPEIVKQLFTTAAAL